MYILFTQHDLGKNKTLFREHFFFFFPSIYFSDTKKLPMWQDVPACSRQQASRFGSDLQTALKTCYHDWHMQINIDVTA